MSHFWPKADDLQTIDAQGRLRSPRQKTRLKVRSFRSLVEPGHTISLQQPSPWWRQHQSYGSQQIIRYSTPRQRQTIFLLPPGADEALHRQKTRKGPIFRRQACPWKAQERSYRNPYWPHFIASAEKSRPASMATRQQRQRRTASKLLLMWQPPAWKSVQ